MSTPRIYPEADHEPIGFSDELFPLSRRWLALLLLVVPMVAASVAALILLERS